MKAKAHARNERTRTKTISNRHNQFIAFIDLKKAFDSVNRSKLIEVLLEKQFDKSLISTIKNMLEGTVMNYQGHKTETFVGVPQGAITSPTLFNIYIDSLVSKLSQLNT